uniref:Uncharacterized protein n=1 Tax=Chromera velia CCMP2878 TaxID=1169474 RepID=A0A0G4I2G9_9ALVE|eukprot:Cvel_10326.t1-p1 / transcript=Cvel_10326.t1 / gene=Cvel_10326 / organism=Chromera_velia_CCMP2878 / gene_product=hypothetical protein / transcript_product=hypothetical protein / location=Cvel_scaffold620:29146-29667(-) / protein_length=174 / sequence_SO=supercontig / SO=protein_coding / is_pseudo=false
MQQRQPVLFKPTSSISTLRKLVKALDPRYDLPSVGKVQRLLFLTLKNEIILSIKDRLRKAATRRVSITLDIWSHSGKLGFLAITIHWLTENFEMDSASFLDPETTIYYGAKQIGEMVRKVLNLLGISLEEVLRRLGGNFPLLKKSSLQVRKATDFFIFTSNTRGLLSALAWHRG